MMWPNTTVLTVDPGIPFGWALWSEAGSLVRWGVENVAANARDMPWQYKSERMAYALHILLTVNKVHGVYCELPTYMSGHAAASGGSLVKLCFTVGRFMQVCSDLAVPFRGIEVRDWLGQLTDKAIRHRVETVLPEYAPGTFKPHCIDAVGMGLHVLGKWPK
jgi:hypothetical protein